MIPGVNFQTLWLQKEILFSIQHEDKNEDNNQGLKIGVTYVIPEAPCIL